MKASGGDEVRYEIKAESAGPNLDFFLSLLDAHPMKLCRSYAPRQVNNLYYDNYELQNYCDNLEGGAQRKKLRLRWYGQEFKCNSAQFEVKYKMGGLSWKDRVELPQFSLSTRHRESYHSLLENLPLQFRHLILCYNVPILINNYFRYYFETYCGRLRVTIDSSIFFYDQTKTDLVNVHQKGSYPVNLVVEVKCAKDDFKLAQQFLQGLPLRVCRYSKYVTGVQSLLAG